MRKLLFKNNLLSSENNFGTYPAGILHWFIGVSTVFIGSLFALSVVTAPLADDLITLSASTVLSDLIGNRITILQTGEQIEIIDVQKERTEVLVANGFPVWASEVYLKTLGWQVEVTAEALRARSLPGRESDLSVLGMLRKGYRARVLARSNGWVRIQGPSSIRAYIDTSAIAELDGYAPQQPVNSIRSADSTASSSTPSSRSGSISSGSSLSRNAPLTNKAVNASPSTTQSRGAVSQPRVASQLRLRSGGILDLESTYRLAAGDTVSVSVFGEPDLSVTDAIIPSNGIFSFPLIGSVQFAGKTTDQIANAMEASLSGGYVKDAEVTVLVNSYRPIYVRGGVESPGAYSFTEGLTVAKAIALAGGASQSAVFAGVSVTRENQLIQNQLSLDSETRVMPGDIIYLAGASPNRI